MADGGSTGSDESGCNALELDDEARAAQCVEDVEDVIIMQLST